MGAQTDILLEKKSGVAILTFNRPPANAYNEAFHETFNRVLDDVDHDSGLRVAIIRSQSRKFFCAGADIKEFLNNETASNKRMVDLARQALGKIESSGKVYIAEIAGHALGGGLEIALACDFRFASTGDYVLGLPEVKLGLMPGNGGSQRLPRLIGLNQAKSMLMTGESISPEAAFKFGLLDRLVEPDALVLETEAFAETLSAGAPLALAAVKRSLNEGMGLSLPDSLRLESELVDTLYDTNDAREGFASYLEKRPPQFDGT